MTDVDASNPWKAIASELGYSFERDLHPPWRRLTSHPDGASFWVNLDHVVRILGWENRTSGATLMLADGSHLTVAEAPDDILAAAS